MSCFIILTKVIRGRTDPKYFNKYLPRWILVRELNTSRIYVLFSRLFLEHKTYLIFLEFTTMFPLNPQLALRSIWTDHSDFPRAVSRSDATVATDLTCRVTNQSGLGGSLELRLDQTSRSNSRRSSSWDMNITELMVIEKRIIKAYTTSCKCSKFESIIRESWKDIHHSAVSLPMLYTCSLRFYVPKSPVLPIAVRMQLLSWMEGFSPSVCAWCLCVVLSCVGAESVTG